MTDGIADYRHAMYGVRLTATSSALIVVDLQYGSAAPGFGYAKTYSSAGLERSVEAYLKQFEQRLIPNVARLQRTARSLALPIVFLTFGTIKGDYSDMPPRFRRGAAYWNGLGIEPPYGRLGDRNMDVLDSVRPQEGERVFPKTTPNGFASGELAEYLRGLGVESTLIVGVATSYCVEATIWGAVDSGFDPVVVVDGCGDTDEAVHSRAIEHMAGFARLATTDDVIWELTKRDEDPLTASPTDGSSGLSPAAERMEGPNE